MFGKIPCKQSTNKILIFWAYCVLLHVCLYINQMKEIQYIPRTMHTVFALLCFVVIIHWLIFPYPSGLLHWHCDNLTIAPVPAKQPWWIWINTSCEFIMNDCITTTKQSTTKPCAYFLGYTVSSLLPGKISVECYHGEKETPPITMTITGCRPSIHSPLSFNLLQTIYIYVRDIVH